MKHIEHATAEEIAYLANLDQRIRTAKLNAGMAVALKRAIAERCRQRARVLRAKHEGKAT